jgi:hypothetical protein
MADYFYVLDAAGFEDAARPALAEAWRRRSFEPARPLCVGLSSAAREYAERYHTGSGESLVERVAAGSVPFDRALWRGLVGEVLLFSALEIPEFQVNADTLVRLLAPEQYANREGDRVSLAPIRQALEGSRDLTFGPAIYRPEHAGWNPAEEVRRLAAYLAAVRPEAWSAGDLAGLRDVPPEDYDDELAFAREWFPALAGLYASAAEEGRAIVYESIF